MTKVRNVTKTLAVTEDLALGKDSVLQARGTGRKIDLHITVDTAEDLLTLDAAKHHKARIYTDTGFNDFSYVADPALGIKASNAPGSWVPSYWNDTDILTKLCYTFKGLFSQGFTYSEVGNVGIDTTGNVWTYTGSGTPNKVVTAGTVPGTPDYTQVTFNQASNISYSENGDVDSALRKRASRLTLAQAKVSDLQLGQRVLITDRYNAEMEVVNRVTADDMVYHDIDNGLTLQLRPFGHEMYLEWLGATGSINQNIDAVILKGVELLRSNPSQIQEGIGAGSPMITAYTSGTILLGRGVYTVSPETLNITQDIGLTIRGQGYSGQQNFKRGATTLLIDGASTTYGVRSFGNGGRSFKLQDLDLCYSNPAFTGRLLDNLDAVGIQLENVYLGCFGVTALDRLFTASSLLGMTYAEYANFKSVVFNGAVNFVEFDNTRTIGGSTFGCSSISFENCVGYDCTGVMVKNDGTRTIVGLDLDFSFNPITTNCVRAVDLDNIDGLTLQSLFTPSTAATGGVTEWLRAVNCTGSITDCEFGSLTKAGTISGDLDVSGNKFGGTDGLTVKSGNITGGGNEFRTGTHGWLFLPDNQLTIDLKPDRFDGGVTSSYYLPTDSTLVSGQILYSWERDNSTSKFEINTSRVRVDNAGKIITVSTTPVTTPFVETGNIQNVGGLAQNMQVTIPSPKYCTGYAYSKFLDNPYTLTLIAPVGKHFICGESGIRTQAVATNVGSYIEFESVNAVTYIVTSLHGDWVFS